MTRSEKRGVRSYITGEKGCNRVRLYAHPRNGTLLLEWRDESGRKERMSLRHSDFEAGKAKADELALALRSGANPRGGEITLKALFDNYEREVTPTKGRSGQEHDRRARKLFEECWGAGATVCNLDRRDWDRFIKRRRSGELKPKGGSRSVKGVRNRAIEQNLKYMLAVCNWGGMVLVKGRLLIERNPFKGFPLPAEKNPERPMIGPDEYARLRVAAKSLGPSVELYLLLVHDTGHRCSAVSRLQWSDVDLSDAENAKICWRSEHDKIGLEHAVPITPEAGSALVEAREALQEARRATARIEDSWIFPCPTNTREPIKREALINLWRRLERVAGLPHVQGRGWHSLRRKFATERMHTAPAVLCALGGWQDYETIRKCYMQPDDAALRSALLDRRAVGA